MCYNFFRHGLHGFHGTHPALILAFGYLDDTDSYMSHVKISVIQIVGTTTETHGYESVKSVSSMPEKENQKPK